MNTIQTGWDKAAFAMSNGLDRLLLYGVPGTGKTYFGLNYFTNNKPSYRLICTEEMSDGDIVGHYKPVGGGEWKFHEGVAVKAWRTGGRLVVDEINRANGDIESRLMSIIDTVASSSWEHPETGEVVKPAEGFSVVATMNGEPEDLAPAVLDRLVVRSEITEAHPDAIAALPEYLRALAQHSTSKEAEHRYSLRSFFAFHTLYHASGSLEAAAAVTMPTIAEQLVDCVSLAKVETKNG